MLNLPRLAQNWNWNTSGKQENTFRSGVREINPVSIYGEVYGREDLKKRCVIYLYIYLSIYLSVIYLFIYYVYKTSRQTLEVTMIWL